jgi:16S rRNA U1498 N3-methylase RsmE
MTEVTYVWELKQSLNKLTRKMRKLKEAAQQGNVKAMIAINFSYAGSRLLWELDDNTIIMEQLAIDQAELDTLAAKHNVTLDPNDYEESSLDAF